MANKKLESYADDLAILAIKAFPGIDNDNVLTHAFIAGLRDHSSTSNLKVTLQTSFTQTPKITNNLSKAVPILSSDSVRSLPTTVFQSTFPSHQPRAIPHRTLSPAPLPHGQSVDKSTSHHDCYYC